ncbi:hypothetical protein P4E94_19335 [Pontiellaceae bacterium B12219]|nr:hypothetical protein [Pontiellaceae bacterium B12219]
MKIKTKGQKLVPYCKIEIYRDGKKSGHGQYLKKCKVNKLIHEPMLRIINEKGMIETVLTQNINRTVVEL